jgi:hypothetical protein
MFKQSFVRLLFAGASDCHYSRRAFLVRHWHDDYTTNLSRTKFALLDRNLEDIKAHLPRPTGFELTLSGNGGLVFFDVEFPFLRDMIVGCDIDNYCRLKSSTET